MGQRIFVFVVTLYLVTAIGAVLKRVFDSGDYGTYAAVCLLIIGCAFVLAWFVGGDDDKDDFKAIGRWFATTWRNLRR